MHHAYLLFLFHFPQPSGITHESPQQSLYSCIFGTNLKFYFERHYNNSSDCFSVAESLPISYLITVGQFAHLKCGI